MTSHDRFPIHASDWSVQELDGQVLFEKDFSQKSYMSTSHTLQRGVDEMCELQ